MGYGGVGCRWHQGVFAMAYFCNRYLIGRQVVGQFGVRPCASSSGSIQSMNMPSSVVEASC